MINEIYKDITTVTRGIVVHGVNGKKAMGSGVALAIKNKWPIIYDKYMESDATLGDADIIEVELLLYVANCYTQESYGSDGKRYAEPGAILTSLTEVYEFAEVGLSVNLPKIGSERGGLDWETEVLPIIEDLDNQFKSVETNLYLWR
jgi:O-acetyl-ADP-ribose deacetylase (regulator of RNase III)